jgi:hypothetical protein
MKKKFEKIYIAALLIFLFSPLVLFAQNDQIQILSISRNPLQDNRDRESSLEGGTLFYVKGTGFDTQMADNNHVYVGSIKVDVEGIYYVI